MADTGGRSLTRPTTARSALQTALQAPDSYGLVLGLLLLNFILTPSAPGVHGLAVRVMVQAATLLFALHTSRVHRRTMVAASAIAGLSVVLALLAVMTGEGARTQGALQGTLALLLLLTVPAVLRRILTAPEIGLEIIFGALDVYLIFGLLFSALYAAIGELLSVPFFTNPHHVAPESYQFFSFVTLLTVGYGNLVPASELGQSLAVLEALVGQVYLVTLVARLVSGMQPGSSRRAHERLLAEREARERAARDHPDGDTGPSSEQLAPTTTRPSTGTEAPETSA